MSIFLYIIIMGRFRCYENGNNVATACRIAIKIDSGITGLIPDKIKKSLLKSDHFDFFDL